MSDEQEEPAHQDCVVEKLKKMIKDFWTKVWWEIITGLVKLTQKNTYTAIHF